MVDIVRDENVLAVIPAPCGTQRLVFLARQGQVELPIVLRQESFSRDVGWFVQSQVEMSREQMVLLRSAFGAGSAQGSGAFRAAGALAGERGERPATVAFPVAG